MKKDKYRRRATELYNQLRGIDLYCLVKIVYSQGFLDGKYSEIQKGYEKLKRRKK